MDDRKLIKILTLALKELNAISGEANIPMVNVKAVRQMARFVRARENAQKAIALAEQSKAAGVL